MIRKRKGKGERLRKRKREKEVGGSDKLKGKEARVIESDEKRREGKGG